MSAKRLHRLSAILLIAFIAMHLGVHLTALAGAQAHLVALDSVQWAYRHPVAEAILVAIIAGQVFTGLRRLRLSRRHPWARVQAFSGLYLAVFMTVHTGAALYTHWIFGLETDFYWAAGSLALDPIRYGFAVYYSLAVVAVFLHVAAALRFGWPRTRRVVLFTIPAAGVIVGALIVAAFAGAFYPIEITVEVLAYYEKNFGMFGIGR